MIFMYVILRFPAWSDGEPSGASLMVTLDPVIVPVGRIAARLPRRGTCRRRSAPATLYRKILVGGPRGRSRAVGRRSASRSPSSGILEQQMMSDKVSTSTSGMRHSGVERGFGETASQTYEYRRLSAFPSDDFECAERIVFCIETAQSMASLEKKNC